MKNSLISLSLIVLFANSVVSQKDSVFLGNIIVKINPALILGGAIAGIEYGGTIQIPLIKKKTASGFYYKVDAFIGGGENKYYAVASPQGHSPSGYTIRGGLYYFLTKERKKYLSLQYFFRQWSFVNSIDYPIGTNAILNPISVINSEGGDPDDIYNATVDINCIDVIYGNQIFPLRSKRFILDWYIGLGMRIKNIQQSITGFYTTPHVPYPYPASEYSQQQYYYPDIKLGLMVGYIL